MFNLKTVAAAGALLAATVATPLCGAQTVDVLTAGSSAQWGVFAEAARALALAKVGNVATNVHHCTVNGPLLRDQRGASVPDESGKIWIVWTTSGSSVEDIWAYLSVDSVVGVRAFMASPKDLLVIPGTSAPTCGNLLSAPANAGLFPESDDPTLNSTVEAALQNHVLTAANTDVRPEDALFTTKRAIRTLDTTSWDGLGIGTNGNVTDTTSAAHVVPFALSGNDPFSTQQLALSRRFRLELRRSYSS